MSDVVRADRPAADAADLHRAGRHRPVAVDVAATATRLAAADRARPVVVHMRRSPALQRPATAEPASQPQVSAEPMVAPADTVPGPITAAIALPAAYRPGIGALSQSST